MARAHAVLSIAVLVSCRAAPAGRANEASAKAAPAKERIDAAEVKAMSHALLDDYDQAAEDGCARALGPAFVLFDEQRLEERDAVLSGLRARRGREAPTRSRTYGEEHVWVSDNSAVFIGDSVEHYPLDGARPAGDFDGWSTLVWVREGDGWRAASWQWVKAGREADRAMWNAEYREGRGFNPQASKFLVEMVKGRKPGRALDVAMGQGRNALYLASQGWRVTGFDIADEGLRQAREAAAARKLHIEAISADTASWDYGIGKWDLVALIYTGCDAKTVETLRRSLKRGGLVVSERFHKEAVPAIGVETGELTALFKDGFKVLREEVVEDVSDWGNQRGVREKLVRFAAEKR